MSFTSQVLHWFAHLEDEINFGFVFSTFFFLMAAGCLIFGFLFQKKFDKSSVNKRKKFFKTWLNISIISVFFGILWLLFPYFYLFLPIYFLAICQLYFSYIILVFPFLMVGIYSFCLCRKLYLSNRNKKVQLGKGKYFYNLWLPSIIYTIFILLLRVIFYGSDGEYWLWCGCPFIFFYPIYLLIYFLCHPTSDNFRTLLIGLGITTIAFVTMCFFLAAIAGTS